MIQQSKDQSTNGLSRLNAKVANGILKLKSAVVNALDGAISSLRKLLTKAKTLASEKVPSVKKIKDYLSKAKQKITSIKSVADLKYSIQVAYENTKRKISGIR